MIVHGNLKPWFAIARPHEDIRQGRLDEAVFAANLWAVAQGSETAPEVYTRPEIFFQKTYLTNGLTNVLQKVARALAGRTDAGDRILNLQTAFGGGKTHILIALWHLAKHTDIIRESEACDEVKEALGGQLPEEVNAVAVFTNQSCDATQGRQTPEGIHTRTLWGELALQLGGVELYKRVEANDQSRTVPQGIFVDILKRAAPCLILIDELADYCVGASAVEVGGSTLADQTISFVQQLTEAIQEVPRTALVATLPASHLEVASSELGQEILNRLGRRFGLMSADIKPISDEENEIYEVVRRRLFENLGDEAEHKEVADAYAQLYQSHRNEVPAEATRATYRDRILQAYPFHPELIDAFHLRWASHDDFQRARGVLTMLAGIVSDLWQRRGNETQSQPLIQPCHIRWSIDILQGELTRLWGNGYGSVVDADIIGEKANATLLDEERGEDYAREKITQGLAATMLLGSFGGQGERIGFSSKDLKLCVGRPTVNWGYTDGALLAFEDQSFYLHTASAGNLGKRYWFGTKPTLRKLVVQYRQRYARQSFDEEIVDLVRGQLREERGSASSATWRVLVDPGPELSEQRALTLVILPPDATHSENGATSPAVERIRQRSEKCGNGERLYRNTLLFLAPSERGISKLRQQLRDLKAHQDVRRDYSDQLDEEQKRDLAKRLDQTEQITLETLGTAYSYVARVEGSSVVIKPLPETGVTLHDHLESVWRYVVQDEEWVIRKVGPVTLQQSGLIPEEDGSRVKDAIEAFLRYTDKPMIASPQAVVEGLVQACEERLIGIGRGVSLDQLQRRWCGERVSLDPGEEGLWIIPPFEPEPAEAPEPTTEPRTSTKGVSEPAAPSYTETEPAPSPERPVRRIKIRGSVPPENWGELFRCFVNPAVNMRTERLQLGIDIEIEASEDRPLDAEDQAVKKMREAAQALGLDMDLEE